MVSNQPEESRGLSGEASVPKEQIAPSIAELATSVEYDYRLIQGSEITPSFRALLEQFDVRTAGGDPL